MTDQIMPSQTDDAVLMGVREGMPVYDLDHDKIGKVVDMRSPGHTSDDVSMWDYMFANTAVQNAPEVMRSRLAEAGYIHVGSGLFRKDYYVTLDQVDHVTDEGVILNVYRDDLFQY